MSADGADAGADPRRWRALAVTQLAAFMVLLDVSIVNVALPSMERGMHMPATTAQWVVSGYALTLGLTLVPAGRLGDALGRRRMFLIALAAFVVTSSLTGAAPSVELLIAARLVQGVAGGLILPQNSGADPADVPGGRTRPRVRDPRGDRRAGHRGGSGGRRADPGRGDRS
jgi:MFS family permease